LPAVILLDLKLPRVDGLEVLRQIKANMNLRGVPIVVLTTSADNQDVKKAYELGANSYIVKPVDFDKFVEVASQIEVYWTVLNSRPS
jgi:CheY-like chemotaxis protein